jgi:hypothetical protein
VHEDLHDVLMNKFARRKTVDVAWTLIFPGAAWSVSLLLLLPKAANITGMDICNQSEEKLPKIQS